MSGILLNLLAATAGGQITRAEAFLKRFRKYAPNERLVIIKDQSSLNFCDYYQDWDVINVDIGRGRLRALRRIAWENLNLPRLMDSENLSVFLTFSHYLPLTLNKSIRTIVGVSNLAPFSKEAWKIESASVKLKMWLLRHSIVASAERATKVIALSETCGHILDAAGVDASKIVVIPNGVEQNSFEENSSNRQSFVDPYILSVSHFHRYKNYERLIEAYKSLPTEFLNKYRLLLVGKPYDCRYYSKILNLIVQHRLSDRVTVIPGVPPSEIKVIYRNAKLFVFTSLIENSPNILLEALTYGLPILASNTPPMPEFGGDAINYFETLSSSDLSQKMCDLLSDEDALQHWGELARQRSTEYSWDTFTDKVIATCH